MAITTTLQPKYTLQKVLSIVICLGLGLWGLYDHQVAIPKQARAYERGQVCLAVRTAMEAEPGSDIARRAITDAEKIVNEQLDVITAAGSDVVGSIPDPQEIMESIRARGEEGWLSRLLVYKLGLEQARRRIPETAASDQFSQIFELVKRDVNETAEVSPPGAFDRLTQWMFILCLPFVPWFLWAWLRERKRVFTLEDDGSLRTPNGTLAADDIADIDMSRWMSKSIAEVVATDGRRIKLDDYLFKNTDRIVGTIASERYPDQWTDEAKPVGREETPAEPEPEDEDEDEAV